MKSSRYPFARGIAFAMLLSMSGTQALAEQKTPPPPGPPRPIAVPPITEQKLANGLTVVMAPTKGIPKFTAVLSVRAGAATARESMPGVSQMAAGVLSEGTATRSSKQIREELRSMGASLGSGSDSDITTVSGSALSEFSERYFALMSDVIQHPAFPDSEVALAKENTIEGLKQQRSDPNFLGNEQLVKAIYGNHPYSFVTATEEQIGKIARADLQKFASTYYVPSNAFLVIVGDIDPAKTLAEVTKAFGSWAGPVAPVETIADPPMREKRQIIFVNRPDSIQSTIFVGNATFPRKAPDYYSVRTANIIYCGSFYSRLTKNIREDKGYTYSPNSSLNTSEKSGSFVVSAAVRNEVTGPTLLEIFYELDKMRVLPVTDEELSSAKTFSKGSFSIELANQGALAFRINSIYAFNLQKDFISTFGSKIDALTAADLERAAAKYFDTYRCAVVVVGDWEKVKDQVTPFGAVTVYDANGKQLN